MKFIQKNCRITSVIMTFLFLCQSCTIYRGASSTLDEAVESKRKVRVHLLSGAKATYKKVIKKEDGYYGIIKKDTLLINSSNITRIQLKNRTLSTVGTVLLSSTTIFLLMVGITIAAY